MALTSIADLNPDNLEQGLSILDSVAQRMEDQIEAEPGDGNERAGGIHASEISGCQRRLVYSVMDTKRQDKIAFVWRRRFKLGHKIHDMLQEEFKQLSYSPEHFTRFTEEVKISPTLQKVAAKWEIHSSCDGVFEIGEKSTGTLLLRAGVEIKSMNPDEFSKLTKPKPEHIEQAHVYMACLDLPMMWFLYFNKGNQNYTKSNDHRFIVPFNPKLWAELEARFEIAHNNAYLKQLPDKEESMLCQFCPFSYTCQPESLNRSRRAEVPRRFIK